MPLTQVFVSISDPRSARHTRHDLAELLTVAVCAVLSGVDDFVDIERKRRPTPVLTPQTFSLSRLSFTADKSKRPGSKSSPHHARIS